MAASIKFQGYTFLGTRGGLPIKAGNTSAGLLGLSNGQFIIVDAGECVTKTLLGMDFPFEKITDIFITHLHLDHIGGLLQLMVSIDVCR